MTHLDTCQVPATAGVILRENPFSFLMEELLSLKDYFVLGSDINSMIPVLLNAIGILKTIQKWPSFLNRAQQIQENFLKVNICPKIKHNFVKKWSTKHICQQGMELCN